VDALLARDRRAPRAVIEGDRDLDTMELEVEELAISLLALQQPMARDLRFLIGAIKVSSDLERVGDHAVNIAQCAIRLVDARSPGTQLPEIDDMAAAPPRMLGDALDAFTRGDGELGRAVCRADDQVDALHDSVFRLLITHMTADPRTITPSLELLLVSRNLERVADLATNIGEGRRVPRRGQADQAPQRGSARRKVGPGRPRRQGTSEGRADGQARAPARDAPCAARARGDRPARAPPRGRRGDIRIAAIDIGSNSDPVRSSPTSRHWRDRAGRRDEGDAAARRRRRPHGGP
jgi:phosphate transport system protein